MEPAPPERIVPLSATPEPSDKDKDKLDPSVAAAAAEESPP
jgi:hypothetical protein